MEKLISKILKDDYYLTSNYGNRSFILNGKPYSDFHKGTDYGTHGKNINVYSPCDINVTSVGYSSSAGNYLIASMPNGDKFKIQHLFSYEPKGSYKKGEVIAVVGNTGKYTTGTHIHLEIFVNDKNVNPEEYDSTNISVVKENKYTTGTYVTNENMYLRKGNGTEYDILTVADMSVDGKKNATSTKLTDKAVYKKGTRWTVLEVKIATNGGIWGKGYSGWSCIEGSTGSKFCSKI